MVSEISIQQYEGHIEVYEGTTLLKREEALELLNRLYEAADDEQGVKTLARTIHLLEREQERLS